MTSLPHKSPESQELLTPSPIKRAATDLGAAAGKLAGAVAHSTRESIRHNPTADKLYRISVGVVGGATVALGVVLLPLPGPGSLVILGGLGVLSTEFDSAKKARVVATDVTKKAATAFNERRQARKNPR